MARPGRARRAAALLAVGAAALTVIGAAPAHASAARPAFTTVKAQANTGGRDASLRLAKEAASYWTAARMRDAVAIGLPANVTRSAVAPSATGRPGAVPALAARTAQVAALGVGVPKSATVGKVFAHDPVNNRDYQCSASTIGSPSMMLVLTAGHCAHGGRGGTWATNWMFIPLYTNGVRPYGTWYPKYYTAFNEWQNSSDHDRDLGFVTMWPNFAGQRIVDVVGGNGLSWNQAYEQAMTILGYPVDAPFTGETQQSSSGGTFRLGTWPFQENTLATWCNLTGGASGGPWLRNYAGGVGFVNGVMSTKDANGICRSPYFDDAVHNMFVNIGSAV
jgi:V8-like Glu-specific endopeptidase